MNDTFNMKLFVTVLFVILISLNAQTITRIENVFGVKPVENCKRQFGPVCGECDDGYKLANNECTEIL